MKIEARTFLYIAVFCWLIAIAYAIWTDMAQGRIEVAGFAALLLSGGLLGISGSFFWFVSRRIDARPEDRDDAEIAEGAGDLGFFPPGSYWPFGLALAALTAGLGLAFVQAWLMAVGAAAILFMTGGLVFEFYLGGRKTLS